MCFRCHTNYYTKSLKVSEKRKNCIQDVGSGVGLSASYLSQIETGKVEPTISTLRKLAQFYGVSIVYFFETEISQDVVVRKADRKQLWHDDKCMVYEPLQGSAKDKIMQATYIKILPEMDTFFSPHPGEEFMIVVKGLLRFKYEDVTYDLYPGDSIYYNASRPFIFSNPLKQEIEVLTVCSPPVP